MIEGFFPESQLHKFASFPLFTCLAYWNMYHQNSVHFCDPFTFTLFLNLAVRKNSNILLFHFLGFPIQLNRQHPFLRQNSSIIYTCFKIECSCKTIKWYFLNIGISTLNVQKNVRSKTHFGDLNLFHRDRNSQ